MDTVEMSVKEFGKGLYKLTVILFTFRYHYSPGEDDQGLWKVESIDKLVTAIGDEWYTIVYKMEDEIQKHQQFKDMSNSLRNRITELAVHDDVKTSEDIQEEDASVTIPDLITRLNLNSFYPHKYTTADVVNIGKTSFMTEEVQSEQPPKDDELAFVFLQKLLTLNYRARSILSQSEVEDKSEEDDDFENFLNEEDKYSNGNEDKNTQIHPMDVQMAVFHSGDSFLRQNIVTKLSSCQFALPLLIPSPLSSDIEFPLWTFQQIKKTWKSSESFSTTLPACQVKAPMVFFCRLGSVSTSKSHLLNSLINQNHDTFFHRDSPGSSKNCFFIEGLVEIAWYCPAGNTDDLFSECISFCNLHGDAAEHSKQASFLIERSAVTVVVMQNMKLHDSSKNFLQKLHCGSKPLICVVKDLQKGMRISGNNIKIGLKDSQKPELQKELIHAIKTCLKKCNSDPFFSLEESSEVAKHCGFILDEDIEDCQAGKMGAIEIMKLLKEEDVLQIKARFFPCQGMMWHEWGRMNKQLSRMYEDDNQARSKIQQEMQAIRNKQRECSLNNVIRIVHTNLNSSNSTMIYFLKWLGFYLDVFFSGKLSEVTQEYHKQLTDVDLLKQRGEITDEKQNELKRLSDKVDALTLGLEHIMREMGQIYEAWSTSPENIRTDVSTFPAVAADLLISGHPLELMDGDAAHVPLNWIESVLDKVIERLGDQKVFVLSVLGRQSSGKSTMLNTMFGLQFAVNAGKCTRGAFMQLLRVKEEIREMLKFNFLIVIDTEGLQSLELVNKYSTHTHDNELATFVTGLADMTLINIFGENPAEMQDIIQIVVQAFLRMKDVKLTPSCMFVHQNVTDISAGEKNMEGRMRLQDTLDNVTRLAATEEVCSAQYFTDVIKFNIQTDVHYFAQLWEGNPPMAAPNPRYSENAKKLKQSILRAAAQQNSLKLSEFKVRIKDLWTAVLNEDFVFSFKNTLEVAAYRKVEIKYWDWTWKLRKEMLLIQNRMHNMIDNETLESVDRDWIIDKISSKFSTVKKEMEKFFTDEEDAVTLCQWKSRTEQRIGVIHEELIDTTETKMSDLLKLKAACKKLDEMKTQYENELFNRSKDLASKLKDKATDEQELEKNFGLMWNRWVSDLTSEIPRIKNFNIEQEVMNMLSSFYESRTVHLSKQSCLYTQICEKGEYSEYVTMRRQFLVTPDCALNTEDDNSIRELVQQTVREAEKIIRIKPGAKLGYSDAYTQEILDHVKNRVKKFKAERFTLKNEFAVDLSLYICDIAIKKFTELHRVFRDNNDPLIYLEKKKDEFFSIFRKYCQGASATTVFADLICNKLKPSILQAVYDHAAIDAAEKMKTDFPAFNGNRLNLEKHILQDLAETENFQKFITYIINPKKHFSEFINKTFKEQMLEDPRILKILKYAVKTKKSVLTSAIQNATEDTDQNKGDVREWLKRFSQVLTAEMKFTESSMIGAKSQEITDIEFLGQSLNTAIQIVIEDIATQFDQISSVKAEMFRQRPDDVLMEQLCGCWVQCPFCKAICTNTINGHDGDHSVPFHRPEGVNGLAWYQTNHLSIDICTNSIASDAFIVLPNNKEVPYQKYREAGPEYACWSITPDKSQQAYWKWFVCRFQSDLEEHYKKIFQGRGEIPTSWPNISKEDAIKSLN